MADVLPPESPVELEPPVALELVLEVEDVSPSLFPAVQAAATSVAIATAPSPKCTMRAMDKRYHTHLPPREP
jgi:hypothetical protein